MKNLFSFLLEGETTSSAGGAQAWMTIGMLVLVIIVFYFFLIRPQKKQEKEATNMRNSLQVGDEVVTIGGIVGQIVGIKNETVTIATGKDRTKLRFLKTAIREVTVKVGASEDEDAKPAPKAAVEPAKEKADDKPQKKAKEQSPTEETAETPADKEDKQD